MHTKIIHHTEHLPDPKERDGLYQECGSSEKKMLTVNRVVLAGEGPGTRGRGPGRLTGPLNPMFPKGFTAHKALSHLILTSPHEMHQYNDLHLTRTHSEWLGANELSVHLKVRRTTYENKNEYQISIKKINKASG